MSGRLCRDAQANWTRCSCLCALQPTSSLTFSGSTCCFSSALNAANVAPLRTHRRLLPCKESRRSAVGVDFEGLKCPWPQPQCSALNSCIEYLRRVAAPSVALTSTEQDPRRGALTQAGRSVHGQWHSERTRFYTKCSSGKGEQVTSEAHQSP